VVVCRPEEGDAKGKVMRRDGGEVRGKTVRSSGDIAVRSGISLVVMGKEMLTRQIEVEAEAKIGFVVEGELCDLTVSLYLRSLLDIPHRCLISRFYCLGYKASMVAYRSRDFMVG
jgi:hypothetical protein